MKFGAACYLRSKGLTLFLYRNEGTNDLHNGYHVPPGGRTEPGERGIDCVVREFKEETGLTVKDPKLKLIVTHFNLGRLMGGKLNPEDWCVEYFVASDFSGELREERPNSRPLWVPDSSISGIRMYEGDRRILELLAKEGVHQAITQYDGENLIRFDVARVA